MVTDAQSDSFQLEMKTSLIVTVGAECDISTSVKGMLADERFFDRCVIRLGSPCRGVYTTASSVGKELEMTDRSLVRIRNRAAEMSAGGVLLFIDGMMEVAEEFADWITSNQWNERIGVGLNFGMPLSSYQRRAPCLVISRDLFLRLGGFDEKSIGVGFEDEDLAERAVDVGIAMEPARFPLALHGRKVETELADDAIAGIRRSLELDQLYLRQKRLLMHAIGAEYVTLEVREALRECVGQYWAR